MTVAAPLAAPAASASKTIGALRVVPVPHPQGCRSYVVADPKSRQAMAIDPHLDYVSTIASLVKAERWTLPYVVDTHTHADHPSGSRALAALFSSTRIAHQKAQHKGVARHPADGEALHLGDVAVTVRHAPGHTPDHIVLVADGAVFAGDTLLIGGVARTDFLGGDAGTLFDTLRSVIGELPDATVLYPGHDYQGRTESTLGKERADNPWLSIADRAEFVKRLTANAPPRPANMDDLLRLNRDGLDVPESLPAAEAVERVKSGAATSVIDVRSGVEVESEHVAGSRHVPLDEIERRADEIRAAPAPRLILCRTGRRAETARHVLQGLGLGGLIVIEGGIEAYRASGGDTVLGKARMSLERQVRVVAGSLGLLGVALGAFVHPAFLGLAAFIGAGQVFAGLTDWCGMGLLLAKLPWNRSRSGGPTAALTGACAASASPSAGGCSASLPPTGGCSAS